MLVSTLKLSALPLLLLAAGAEAAGSNSSDTIMIILIAILLALCALALIALFYSGAGSFCTCPIRGSRAYDSRGNPIIVHRRANATEDGLEFDERVEVTTTTVQRAAPVEEVTTVTTTQQPQPQQVVQVQQRQNVQHVQRAVAQEEPQHTRAVIVDLPSYGQRAIYDASYVPARRVERMQPQQQQQDYEQQHEYTRQYQRRRADFVPRAPPREFPAWSSRRQYQDQGWTEETEQVLVERNVDATPPPRRRLPPTRMVPQGDYYDDNVQATRPGAADEVGTQL